MCQTFSKSTNVEYFKSLIGSMFLIVAISPVIFKYLQLLRIKSDFSTSAIELNIINKLIDSMEKQQLSS